MYAEIKPSGSLKALVECYWISERNPSSEQTGSYRVLPDGCADLIFDLTPGSENAYWVGTMTESLVVSGATTSRFFGIRFNPGGARGILPVPLNEITDQRVPISAITPSIAGFFEKLMESRQPLPQIEAWLIEKAAASKTFSLIQKVSSLVGSAPGEVKVAGIADSLGVSRQYLNRVMKDSVGIDLKTYQRVLRMRALTDQLKKIPPQNLDWSAVAIDFGFYDQSHLIHDFRELVGLSPTEYLR